MERKIKVSKESQYSIGVRNYVIFFFEIEDKLNGLQVFFPRLNFYEYIIIQLL